MSRPKVALLLPRSTQRRVLDEETISTLSGLFDLHRAKGENALDANESRQLMSGAAGCMTGWGSPRLDPNLLDCAPDLGIMAHSAGSVKPFVSDPLWERGVRVTSVASAIAVDVAHFTVGIMVTGQKRVLELAAGTKTGKWERSEPAPNDLRGCRVGIIGASHVGREVIRLLMHFDVEILIYDPFLDNEAARKLGAARTELDTLFKECDIVSVHAPDVPQTRHMVNASRLALMKEGAILINTARGALVDEEALVTELKRGRIRAFLDVTDPEPPPPSSPLYACPNLVLTPHVAGSTGRGCYRLGRQAAEELRRFFAKESPLFPITREMLSRSA